MVDMTPSWSITRAMTIVPLRPPAGQRPFGPWRHAATDPGRDLARAREQLHSPEVPLPCSPVLPPSPPPVPESCSAGAGASLAGARSEERRVGKERGGAELQRQYA